MKYRNEEQSLNVVLLSGRIVSDLTFLKRIEIIGDKEVEFNSCEFVIVQKHNREDLNLFRLYTTDDDALKKIKKHASKGSRIFIQGILHSSKRNREQRLKLGLKLYSTSIEITQVTNIIDTIYDLYNKDERKLLKKSYENDVDNQVYPSHTEFDDYYN